MYDTHYSSDTFIAATTTNNQKYTLCGLRLAGRAISFLDVLFADEDALDFMSLRPARTSAAITCTACVLIRFAESAENE